jgi:hypothetical protein
MYRICWSILSTVCAGNGDYMESKELVMAWLEYLKKGYPEFVHWIEEKH